MRRDRKKIVKSLTRKGFGGSSRNRDHDYYYYLDSSTRPVFTKVSRGSSYKSIGDILLKKMADQIGLTKSEFIRFIDCPMSAEEYRSILSKKGHT
jgi:hypothetical protein